MASTGSVKELARGLGIAVAWTAVLLAASALLGAVLTPRICHFPPLPPRNEAEIAVLGIAEALVERGGDLELSEDRNPSRRPVDPWGRPYRCFAPPRGDLAPHVFTYGADGLPGGGDDDADLCSRCSGRRGTRTFDHAF